MKERGNKIKIVHLRRFFDCNDILETELANKLMQNPNISKGELFRVMTKNKGRNPKRDTHASAHQAPQHDGKMKGS